MGFPPCSSVDRVLDIRRCLLLPFLLFMANASTVSAQATTTEDSGGMSLFWKIVIALIVIIIVAFLVWFWIIKKQNPESTDRSAGATPGGFAAMNRGGTPMPRRGGSTGIATEISTRTPTASGGTATSASSPAKSMSAVLRGSQAATAITEAPSGASSAKASGFTEEATTAAPVGDGDTEIADIADSQLESPVTAAGSATIQEEHQRPDTSGDDLPDRTTATTVPEEDMSADGVEATGTKVESAEVADRPGDTGGANGAPAVEESSPHSDDTDAAVGSNAGMASGDIEISSLDSGDGDDLSSTTVSDRREDAADTSSDRIVPPDASKTGDDASGTAVLASMDSLGAVETADAMESTDQLDGDEAGIESAQVSRHDKVDSAVSSQSTDEEDDSGAVADMNAGAISADTSEVSAENGEGTGADGTDRSKAGVVSPDIHQATRITSTEPGGATGLLKVGDRVRWEAGWRGEVTGVVIGVRTENFEWRGRTRHCSPEDPQYEIDVDDSPRTSFHKGDALTRIDPE